mgnify:CR=1|jgi:hypothetical protein
MKEIVGISYACYGVSLYIYLSSEISSREKVTIFEWLYSYIENDTRDGLLMSNNVV